MARRLLRRLHLWLALGLGLLVVLLGLSGSLLVYRLEIDRALNPGLWQAANAGERSLTAVLARVAEAYPDGTVRFVRLPDSADRAFEVWMRLGAAAKRIYVAPDGSAILGARGAHAGLIGFLDAFHNHLFLGKPLAHVLGLAAGAGLLAVISGLVLWWPRGRGWRRAFRVRWRGHWLKTAYDLHRFAGVVAAPLLLLSFVTGLSLVYHETARTALVGTLGGPARPEVAPGLAGSVETPMTPDRLLAIARAEMPAATATWTIPGGGARAFVVRFRAVGASHPNGNSYVALHPGSGEVLERHAAATAGPGQQAADLRYPLHIGTALGAYGRPMTAALGALPAVLFGTGVLFWWRRRQRPAGKPDRAGQEAVARTGHRSRHNEDMA